MLAEPHGPGNVRQLPHAHCLALALRDNDEMPVSDHLPHESQALTLAPKPPLTTDVEEALNLKPTQPQVTVAALKRTGGNVTAAAALLAWAVWRFTASRCTEVFSATDRCSGAGQVK